MIAGIFKSMRPQQWIKNFFIFAPLIFSRNIFNPPLVLKTVAAFAAFCFLSSAQYIINDLKDIEEDKLHPLKSKRPLASGQLGKTPALIAAAILAAAAIAMAAGFLIRVVAGGFAIRVSISSWLLICTILLALFLAMGKRRHELVILEKDAVNHRPILKEYNVYLLDQMISVVTASTLIAYCLYTISEETVRKFGTSELIYTVPLVLYGIFRYLYLIHQRIEGGTPEALIIRDRPLLLDIFLWIVAAVLILTLRSSR